MSNHYMLLLSQCYRSAAPIELCNWQTCPLTLRLENRTQSSTWTHVRGPEVTSRSYEANIRQRANI
jgi:hypothetical protein